MMFVIYIASQYAGTKRISHANTNALQVLQGAVRSGDSKRNINTELLYHRAIIIGVVFCVRDVWICK